MEQRKSTEEILQQINRKIDQLNQKLNKEAKAAYTQEEIIEELGLKGKQRRLLDYLKKSRLLHSPITKSPLVYPGEVVRTAIQKINAGKVSIS